MRYNVAQLLKEPIGSTRDYGLDEIFSGAERFADHVHGPLTLMRTHQGVLATAELDVEATKVCGRCLSEYPLYLSLSIEEEFFPMLDINTGRWLSAPFGFEEARIDESHTMEVTEVLRQYVITVSPMKPLCRPECAGLCQHCGVNLNQQECECSKANLNPRGRDLASLLEQRKI